VTIRKAALQIAAVAAHPDGVQHLSRHRSLKANPGDCGAQPRELGVQAGIARVWQDFTDMETGQRGTSSPTTRPTSSPTLTRKT